MISPGSLLEVDHPRSWYVDVREKGTGKPCTYWINGSQLTSEDVAAHVAQHYRNVEVVTIYPCEGRPSRVLKPVPPGHFEYGIRKDIEDFVRGTAGGPAPIAINPIPRKTLTRSF